MPTHDRLHPGLYEALLDQELAELLESHPDLVATFESIDDESAPHTYSQLVTQAVRHALHVSRRRELRRDIVNRLMELLSTQAGLEYICRKKLVARSKPLLTELRRGENDVRLPRPETPLGTSSLLTGSGDDPQLERELRAELMSADQVDILVSFIKWSGLRLLIPAFSHLAERRVPVRIVTTSYMGASDPHAVEWLARQNGFKVRVSYETERTRLHAKAYHFIRESGYSTAYIGSANMSHAAMTSGLEWTVKVSAQDMPHILERFAAEFETYWSREEFVQFKPEDSDRFREAIQHGRRQDQVGTTRFFVDIKPHPFQERILEALDASRLAGSSRNLVVAATGTGKTVVAAFDYARHRRKSPTAAKLLFVAHRKEILEQAQECFRTVLRDPNFGALFVDGIQPRQWDHVFASIQSLNSRQPWQRLGAEHFDVVIVDEAHHGRASSYRPLFDHLRPKMLLGLTATPERMDGTSILPDFDNEFAAEIRLPEALEEKLLCPFHYFGITDPVPISEERFWRNGKYDGKALEKVYTGDDIRARQRLDVILKSIRAYQPDLRSTRGVGFCAGVCHAHFMAEKFREAGLTADVVLGETPKETRSDTIQAFREGRITFLFTVDVFSEGVDIPEINLVLFLRPTESLTVFLQQLGRGLRHAPDKDCLTVLDFVGQSHRKYRMDRKFGALLRSYRRRIDQEIELDFPNLPPGCNVQLEPIAREHVLRNIRDTLGNLKAFIPEAINTFEAETGKPLNFSNFVNETGLSALEILRTRTWSEWKALAAGETVSDPDLEAARQTLRRITLRTDPTFLDKLIRLSRLDVAEEPGTYGFTTEDANAIHYVLWGGTAENVGVGSHRESFAKWLRNTKSRADLLEIAAWRGQLHPFPTRRLEQPFPCNLRLHAAYGLAEIKAALGLSNLQRPGPTGTGVIHVEKLKIYVHLVTFRKEERDFAPTTRYKDYPISREVLHWESQARTTQSSRTGQNYIHFASRGYTILFFARLEKRIEGETAPFLFLGPASELLSYEGSRPIAMTWRLLEAMPAALFEAARTA